MVIYFVLFFYSLLISIILKTRIFCKRAIFLFLNIIPMVGVAILRDDSVGTDLSLYINVYRNINVNFEHYKDVENIELIYLMFNSIINWISGGSEIFFLLVIALLTYGGIYYSYYLKSKDLLISLLTFQGMAMYCTSFNLIKQYIAVSLVCLCYTQLLRDKYIRAILVCLVGCLFHKSCVVFLVCIVFYRFINNYKSYYICSSLVFIGSILSIIFFQSFISFFPKYSLLYSDSGERAISASFVLGIVGIMCYCIVSIKNFIFKSKFDKEREFNSILVLIYGMIWICSYEIYMMYRFIPYFELMMTFIIPSMLCRFRGFLIKGVYVCLLLVYYYVFLYKNLCEVNPYLLRI